MQKEQIKSLLINTTTVILITGVFIVGYFVFTKEESSLPIESEATKEKVAQVATISIEVARTVKELGELKRSVERSVEIFTLPSFEGLKDFSVEVPSETIGRENPFVPTVWKLKIKAFE